MTIVERLREWTRRNRGVALIALLCFGLGVFFGWGNGTAPTPAATNKTAGPAAKKKKVIWTCSMHPQIRLPKKTKCPICFMDLIPSEDDSGGAKDPRQIKISAVGKLLAEIRTTQVQRRPVFLDVRMLGRIAYDETRIKSITAWVSGRLERLFVDYTGVPVRKGDHLVRIYSPELLAAQQELLQAHKAARNARRSGGLVLQAAKMGLASSRQKLALLGLRSWQVKSLLKKGKPSVRINIYAPMGGIVIHKKAMQGMYVKTGSHIYTIADLSQVWVKFEAYERDLPWLHVGQGVSFTTLGSPGEKFQGKIVYIDPMLDPKSRTVSVRVNAKNTDGALKPGMFVRGKVHVSVNAAGKSRAPDRSGKWICPMHPEVVRKRRSSCPICGMRLERIGKHKSHKHPHKSKASKDPLVIPKTAPLLTGRRAVVYVEVPKAKQPTYVGRVVTLGPLAGEYYVVKSGLKAGERVVTHGAFKLDSELQLKARTSMMSPGGDTPDKRQAPQKKRPTVHRRFLAQIQALYDAYFALSEALASDKPKAAKAAYNKLWGFLRKRLSPRGPARLLWARRRTALFNVVKKARAYNAIDLQRKRFELVSKEIIALEREIGHAGMGSYHLAHCPMAFNNRGANWLQATKKLRNPYFGSKMLGCGSFKAAFVGRQGEPVKANRSFVRRLKPTYDAYLALQHALFKDKFADAQKATLLLAKSLANKRLKPRRSQHRRRWRVLHKRLVTHAVAAQKSKQIEALRAQFELLSKDILQLLFIFGHSGKQALFEAYCPMAFKYRGAAWVQSQDQRVHNAYFGAKMAHCGEIRRKFAPRHK